MMGYCVVVMIVILVLNNYSFLYVRSGDLAVASTGTMSNGEVSGEENARTKPSIERKDGESSALRDDDSRVVVATTMATTTTNRDEEGGRKCFAWTDEEADEWWASHPEHEATSETDSVFCFERIRDERKAAIFRRLREVQSNVTNCRDVRVRYALNSNWGTDLEHVADGLASALETGAPFQLAARDDRAWHYAGHAERHRFGRAPACASRDPFCYFLPLSPCPPLPGAPPATTTTSWARDRDALLEYVARPRRRLRRRRYGTATGRSSPTDPASMPADEPCAVVHARRGDVVSVGNDDARRYHAVEDYLRALTTDESARSIRNLLLVTDDADAVDEALLFHPEYDWYYLNKTRHRGSSGGTGDYVPSDDPAEEVAALLAVLRLVRACDVIVRGRGGGFSSLLLREMRKTGRPVRDLWVRLNDSSTRETSEADLRAALRKKAEALTSSSNVTETTLRKHRVFLDDLLREDDEDENDTKCFAWTDEEADEWWASHPDYEATSESDSSFCFQKIKDRHKARTFRYLHDIQNNSSDCDRVNSLYMINSGWGADLSNVAYGLMLAARTGAPFQIARKKNQTWHYAGYKEEYRRGRPPVCPSRDMFCYFLPLSPCPATDEVHTQPLRQDDYDKSAFLEYAARPRRWLRRAVRDHLDGEHAPRVPADEPCAVLHVRRGDVVLGRDDHVRRYFAVGDYLRALRNHHDDDDAARSIRNVLLFTDDADAVDEAVELHPEYAWYYLNRTRHRGSSGGWENQIPSNDPVKEVVAILSILRLARSCDTIVHGQGGFSALIRDEMRKTGRPIRVLRVDEGSHPYNATYKTSETELRDRLTRMRKKTKKESTSSNATKTRVLES